jgi:phage-related protein
VFPIINVKADRGTDLNQPTKVIHVTNNLTVTYNGTVTQENILKFDMGNYVVTNNGTKDMNNIPNTSVFWWLDSGSNSLRYEGKAATLAIMFTPRWL